MAGPKCQECGELTFDDEGRCKSCRAFPTLGYQVAQFIEDRCAIPDRDQMGDPFELTDEQLRFLLWHYRINPHTKVDREVSKRVGRRIWRNFWHFTRGSQLVRPHKWGKGPFSSAMTISEAVGPAYFDGWDAEGRPVGRPWATPLIQITALSEAQTDNVWTALLPMIELGHFAAYIPDTGKMRVYLPEGGMIEPVTSSAGSRLGQRVTFLVQDQTESWTETNKGRALADNQRRNIGGMGGRWLSTCNAWDPSEESVAQHTAEFEVAQGGVYNDDVEPPESLSVRNKRDRMKALKIVYGDSWWVDLERVDAEIAALVDRDPAQAERWYLNRKMTPEARAYIAEVWDGLAHTPPASEKKKFITIGVDGARFVDALAVVATEIKDPDTDGPAHQWPIGIWERPKGAGDNYEHPTEEIDAAVMEAFEANDVWRMYVDPQWIDHLLDRWLGRWGEKRVIPWFTNRNRPIAYAVRNHVEAVNAGKLTHPGTPAGDKACSLFSRHVKQAVRREVNVYDDDHHKMFTLGKDRADSPRKIDGAMAAVLSWEARGDAIADGAQPDDGRGAVAIGF